MNYDDYIIPGPEAFASYIERLLANCGHEAVCGYSNSPDQCPLAQWVADVHQSDDVAIDLDTMWIDDDEFDTPVWMYHVIRAVDSWMDDQGEGQAITTEKMVEILNGLMASMEQLPHE